MSIICSTKDRKDHKVEMCDEGHAAALSALNPASHTWGSASLHPRLSSHLPFGLSDPRFQRAARITSAKGAPNNTWGLRFAVHPKAVSSPALGASRSPDSKRPP